MKSTSSPTSNNVAVNSRNQSLDVLRGVAVLMVILDHYSLVIHSKGRIFDTFGRGVDLFFVLSGFLISGLLFTEYKRTGGLNLIRFWSRRGFKIYPPFYTLLAATAAFSLLRYRMIPHEILGDLFFVQNYSMHVWGHGWSLAVEEHFYFILPMLLWAMVWLFRGSENPFKLIPLISILASVVCFWLRLRAVNHGEAYGLATHLRMDALFAGVALGYFWHFDSKSFREAQSKWVLISGLFVALLLPIMPIFLQLTFAYFASCLIVAWAVHRTPSKGYVSAAMAFIGRHSYSIYLWHAVVAWCMTKYQVRWFTFPAYAGTVIILGVLMSKLVEFPSLRIRDRLFPSVASAVKQPKVCTFATAEICELTT